MTAKEIAAFSFSAFVQKSQTRIEKNSEEQAESHGRDAISVTEQIRFHSFHTIMDIVLVSHRIC